MNQFDALLSQISELEAANRESERKLVTLTQHTALVENEVTTCTLTISNTSMKKKIKDQEELMGELKENVASLTLERDDEHRNTQRLKSKNAQLKAAEALRSKALDEERQAVADQRTALRAQLEENNEKLRNALSSLLDYKLKTRPSSDETTLDDPKPISTLEEELVQLKKVKDELTLQVEQLTVSTQSDASKLTTLAQEKATLEENLAATIKEYETLDDFTQNLQTRYEAIRKWYEMFELWNQSGCCPSCKAQMDVVTMIDRLLEEHNQSGASSELNNTAAAAATTSS